MTTYFWKAASRRRDGQRGFFLFFLLIYAGIPMRGVGQEIILRGKVPVFVSPDEPAPVHRAVADLVRDLGNVLGQPSPIIDKMPASGPVIVVATGSKYTSSQPAVSGWEAHQVFADRGRVVLNGADMRGTIYAVYTFSELVLGIKPLWFWASEPPQRKSQLRIAADFRKVIASPSVRYRTWFPNDRDLITPWQRHSKENYEAFYEAMLRLKLNTLEGGIADFRSFSPPFQLGHEAEVAQQRGLVSTGHHMLIFGSNYQHWETYWKRVRNMPVPELTIANTAALREWWAFHIDLATRNQAEVIWLVAFRGNRDIPFWEFFPDAPKDAESRAGVIDRMVRLQIDLLKEKTGDPHPPMRLTLYNEMSTLVAGKLLKLPDEPSLIRNFVAARRDHFPAPDLMNYSFSGEPVGYYLNFQFTSSGSHLAQAEGLRKMEQNYRMVDSLSKGNLLFSVVNAGNIREHLLELSANAEMMWNFKNFDSRIFLKNFCDTYFGRQAGPEIADLYADFYNSYWQQKKGDIPGFERQYIFQDLRYGRAAEMLLNDMEKGRHTVNPLDNHPLDNPDKGSVGYFRVIPEDNGVRNQVEALLKGTSASIAALEKVTEEADRIYGGLQEGKVFFDDNLRGQAYLMLHLNRMLNFLTQAYQATNDQQARKGFLEKSLFEIQSAKQRLRDAEHGPFAGWYESENKFGFRKIEDRIEKLHAKL